MDRQALLEEKRQRLQELKQRRAVANGASSVIPATSSVIPAIQPTSETPTPSPSTSIAVQTDAPVFPIVLPAPPQPITVEKETVTLDKGVQVTPKSDLEALIVTPPAENTKPLSSNQLQQVSIVNEPAVNEFLKESIKQVCAISYTRHDYSVPLAALENLDSNALGGFLTKSHYGEIIGRPVVATSSSTYFPELVVVAYGEPTNLGAANGTSPGLAIVYNTSSSPFFPEYFLHATAAITSIIFDRSVSNRVYAGLKNGQLVMYDFSQRASTKTAQLPSLSSPVFSVARVAPSRSYAYHSRAIVLLVQVTVAGNELIVLSSSDGIVNVWSPNLLSHPRLDLIRLSEPVLLPELAAIKRPLSIKKMVVHSHISNTVHAQGNSDNYLNSLVVASNSLHLLQLCSDPKRDFIDWKLSTNIIDVILLPLLPKQSCIVTATLEWTLLLFLAPNEPILIPTHSLVLSMAARPRHHKQFVTLCSPCNASLLDLVISYWDIGFRLFCPIKEVPAMRAGICATTISFDTSGDSLLVGFADGYVEVWQIDQSLLEQDRPQGIEIDKGIDNFLHKRGMAQID